MKLTVFTPTYNRFDEIKGLYETIISNVKEMNKDNSVEWLIVDDGSKEDITPVIKSFKKIKGLEIILIKKENGGKHTAFNLGIEKSTGDYFVCIDDDDRLSENAVNKIFDSAKKHLDGTKGAVVGRVINTEGKIQGKNVFTDTLISNTIEIRDKYNFWGEPEVYDNKILKQYRFDVFEGERFLTEAYLFDKMSIKYPFVYTNEVYMIKKFLKGGLTDNQLKIRIESPRGTEAYYYKRKNLCKGFYPKLKATINRQRFAVYTKDMPKRSIDFYEVIAKPISALFILKDKK